VAQGVRKIVRDGSPFCDVGRSFGREFRELREFFSARITGVKVAVVLAIVLSAPVFAEPTEPPTAFEGGYVKPEQVLPEPTVNMWPYVDVAAMVLFLAVGTIFLHGLRSRRAVRLVSVGALAYFGFFRQGCVCAVGAVQNIALALGQGEWGSAEVAAAVAVPIPVLAVFAVPLLWALFAGRVFCGAVCPLGAIQDLVHVRSFRVPRWLDAGLRLGAVAVLLSAVLLAALGAGFLVCRFDPFVGFFRLAGPAVLLLAGGAVLALGVVVGRPYCRWACPYGVLLAAAGRLSRPLRLSTSAGTCVTCRLCERVCPVDAIESPTPAGPMDEAARRSARRAMAAAVLAVPVLVAAGAVGGALAGPGVAKLHPVVRAAERVAADRGVPADAVSNETRAARRARTEDRLQQQAVDVRRQFAWGTAIAAALFGLAAGGRLIALSRRRHRDHHEIDTARCVSCARCYSACPVRRRHGDDVKLAAPKEQDESKTDKTGPADVRGESIAANATKEKAAVFEWKNEDGVTTRITIPYDESNAVQMKGSELGEGIISRNELRKRAKQHARSFAGLDDQKNMKEVPMADGRSAQIPMDAIDHTVSHIKTKSDALAVIALPSLIKRAEKIGDDGKASPKRPNVDHVEFYYASLNIGENRYVARMTFQILKSGKKKKQTASLISFHHQKIKGLEDQ